jgi:hypothetical protein
LNIQYVKSTAPKFIDPTEVQHHVPLSQVYVGVAATATMHEIEAGARPEDVQQFRNDCKNFLMESIVQIQTRFDSDSELLMVELHLTTESLCSKSIITISYCK